MGAQGRSVSARRRNGSGSPQRSPREQIWITGSRSGSGKMPIERRTQGPHSCSSLVPVHPLSPHLLTHHLSAPAPCSSHMGGTAPGPGAFELRALPVGSTPSTHSPLHRGLAYHQCPERERRKLGSWDRPFRPAHSMSKLSTRRGAMRCHCPSGG